jgi:excisionase family DNA binding protein
MTTIEDSDRLNYTIDGAARALGVTRTRIYDFLNDEDEPLESFKVGKRRLIPRDSLIKFNNRLRAQGTAA